MTVKQSSLPHWLQSDQIVTRLPTHVSVGSGATEIVSMTLTSFLPQAGYLNNEEAAAYLNLSPRTLEKKRVIGGGPKFRKHGRRVAYSIEDLKRWSDERTCSSTAETPHSMSR